MVDARRVRDPRNTRGWRRALPLDGYRNRGAQAGGDGPSRRYHRGSVGSTARLGRLLNQRARVIVPYLKYTDPVTGVPTVPQRRLARIASRKIDRDDVVEYPHTGEDSALGPRSSVMGAKRCDAVAV